MGTAVYVGLIEDGSEVAVKRMLTAACNETAKNEVEIFKLIGANESPFIVTFRKFLKDDLFSYVIVDLCEESLREHVPTQSIEHLMEHGPRMIKEILTGLRFLHDLGILHRDLKPSNVLVDTEGKMRLVDFGQSRILNADETSVVSDLKGTKGWVSAEDVMAESNETAVSLKKGSDVQVAGMIAFFILTKGRHPFGSLLVRMKNILNGHPVNLDMLKDLHARKFVSWLISHEICDRPSAHEALDHFFMVQAKDI